MKIAIIEIFGGMNEWILYRDKRRLWQVCHYIKRGFLYLFSFGRVNIPLIDYYAVADEVLAGK